MICVIDSLLLKPYIYAEIVTKYMGVIWESFTNKKTKVPSR